MKSRKDKSLPVLCTEALFLKVWAEHDEIECIGACGHAVCQDCGWFEVERDRLEGRNDDEAKEQRKQLDLLEQVHAEEHQGERKYAEDAWFQGETYPQRMTTIRIDAPTQHQFDIPRQKRISRDLVKSLDNCQRWASKITGAQVAGAGMYAFVARAALGSGPNLVATCLMITLSRLVASGFTLGLRLMLVLDNTTGENKCHAIIVVLAWLVYWDKVQTAGFFCQRVGHTFNELDQSFNTLIKSMLQYAIYTISMLVRYIRQFLQPYGIRDVIVLDHLWDFSGQLLPYANALGGFATSQHGDGMHEFRLKKDVHGVVRLHMRKSSKASGWVPEGPGFEVFKSAPPGLSEVVAAPFKADDVWSRKDVEATVRQWFPFMAVSDEQRCAFKQEWTGDSFSLPADMQPAQLPAAKLRAVPELPSIVIAPANNSSGLAPNPSVRLENPVVNPTFGGAPGHRTQADVRRETGAYREVIRTAVSEFPPIFQTDYILVQLPGIPLAVHCVCNGTLLEQATEKEMKFTTVEYSHTPQPGIPGLWGTFQKKENPTYNRLDKKSGTKFIRHSAVGRAHVVVYSLQMFTDSSIEGKPLRISEESLQQLARIRPDEYAMPQSIPASHAAVCAAPTAARAARNDEPDEDDADDEEEDPPAPIPDDFVACAWEEGSPIEDFFLWSKFGKERTPAWHRGYVVRCLEADRADGFTHDAKFAGERHPRGTTLTAEAAAEGVLVLMRPVADPMPARAGRTRSTATRQH